MKQEFEEIKSSFLAIKKQLSDPTKISRTRYVSLSKEYATLKSIIDLINKHESINDEICSIHSIIDDKNEDQEIKKLAEQELIVQQKLLSTVTSEIHSAIILQEDGADDLKNVILEVRAGTGGEEASLFAAELYRMYQRYSERNSWKFEILGISLTGLGGYKEASACVTGDNVFARLKFESGVHRVQRVPETESSGRLHTSAATVAILPEAEEIDLQIDDKELRIDVYRSSGPGGQSVNTTDSAVRITHIPTGIVVIQQDEKSQHKNKSKAMKVLRARLYHKQKLEKDEQRAKARKEQIGSGDRSERIRTYNFPQSRVSDHRANLTVHNIQDVMDGGQNLENLIQAAIIHNRKERFSSS